jgi:hypothetical protein
MAADPFAGMPDHEVLRLAASHLRAAAAAGDGTVPAVRERLAAREALAELDRRELAALLRRLSH